MFFFSIFSASFKDDALLMIKPSKLNVYKEERLLKKLGLDLPFMVDLSNKLGYYGLVSDTMLNMNEMVNHLWK